MRPITVYTFGDSALDCGRYNEFGLNPGRLIVENDDERFPEFRGQDLVAISPARLDHRARDGSLARDLPRQAQGLAAQDAAVAQVSVGGNDLIDGLVTDAGPGFTVFANTLDAFLHDLPIRPVLVANVYDPTRGRDDADGFGWDPVLARAGHRRINQMIATIASRYGAVVDIHGHFLTGDSGWFTALIEPSLRGASEISRCFLPHVRMALGLQ